MEPNDLREDWIGIVDETEYGNQWKKAARGQASNPWAWSRWTYHRWHRFETGD